MTGDQQYFNSVDWGKAEVKKAERSTGTEESRSGQI